MKLTAKEKELILQKRKEEDLKKPKFTAKLAHDLYALNTETLSDLASTYELLSKENIDHLFSNIKLYNKVLSKGTKFVGFLNEDGTTSWFDDVNYGIESMGDQWATEHLTDIKSIKPRNKSK